MEIFLTNFHECIFLEHRAISNTNQHVVHCSDCFVINGVRPHNVTKSVIILFDTESAEGRYLKQVALPVQKEDLRMSYSEDRVSHYWFHPIILLIP